jgi:hypothetical protein
MGKLIKKIYIYILYGYVLMFPTLKRASLLNKNGGRVQYMNDP